MILYKGNLLFINHPFGFSTHLSVCVTGHREKTLQPLGNSGIVSRWWVSSASTHYHHSIIPKELMEIMSTMNIALDAFLPLIGSSNYNLMTIHVCSCVHVLRGLFHSLYEILFGNAELYL